MTAAEIADRTAAVCRYALAHAGPVTSIQVNVPGTQLMSAGGDGLVKFWALPAVAPRVLTLIEAQGKTCGVFAAILSRGTITKFWYPTTANSKASTGTANAGRNHANQPEVL